MKFIIVGAGTVGKSLAERLANWGNDITLIDIDRRVLEHIPEELDINAILGDGCDPSILIRAGLKDADFLIAVTKNDSINVTVCLSSRLINPKAKRIVRIRDLDFTNDQILQSEREDIFDLVLNTPLVTASYLKQVSNTTGVYDYISFADNELIVTALKISKDSIVANKKISSLNFLREDVPCILNAIVRADKLIIPRGTDSIKPNDLVYCITYPEYLEKLQKYSIGERASKSKNIMISGYSLTSRKLAKILEKSKKNVKMLVPENLKAASLLREFDNVLVFRGNPADSSILIEENIADVDFYFALSDNEEENIMSALLAKKLGAKFTVAIVDHTQYLALGREIGVDMTVNPQTATAEEIIKFIYPEQLLSTNSLVHADALFVEIMIKEDNPLYQKTINDISLPYGILISAVIRDNKAILPNGETRFKLNDKVYIFLAKSAQGKLEKLLKTKYKLL